MVFFFNRATASVKDTARIHELLSTTEVVYRSHPDSAIVLCNNALELIRPELLHAKGKYKRRLLFFKKAAIGNLATVYHERGEMEKVLPYYNQEFELQNELGDRKGMASTLYTIASVYASQGRIPEAIEYHSKSLKIYENLNDTYGQALALYSLGRIYGDMADTVRQEDYYKRAYAIYKKMNDGWGIALMKTSLGGILLRKGKLAEAEKHFRDCLNIYRASSMPDGTKGDKWGIANSLDAIGRVFDRQKKWDSAMVYYQNALVLREQTGYKIGMALSYSEIGELLYKQNKHKESMEYARKALRVSRELGFPQQISKAAKLVSDLERGNGNYKEALEMFDLYYQMTDSLRNDENKRASFRQQLSYEYEKKEEKLRAEQQKKSALDEAEKQQQKKIIYLVSAGLLLVLILALVIWRNLYQNKEKNRIISAQKLEVEEKQKEILDSINYAKRLQQAILAKPDEMARHIPDMFLLYKPKDIVAGDFYFFEVTATHLFIAAADCTGHGVPGAMVSIVCSNALTRCVKEFGLTDPGKILSKTTELVTETFEKSGTDVKDGMDISFLCINKTNGQITWAGANNPLWFTSARNMNEILPTKRSVGKSDSNTSFVSHVVSVNTGDIVYLFTDGYADQFGGPKGKKFKYASLSQLLLSIHQQPLTHQQQELDNNFMEWKRNLEQVDDVCIVGIKI